MPSAGLIWRNRVRNSVRPITKERVMNDLILPFDNPQKPPAHVAIDEFGNVTITAQDPNLADFIEIGIDGPFDAAKSDANGNYLYKTNVTDGYHTVIVIYKNIGFFGLPSGAQTEDVTVLIHRSAPPNLTTILPGTTAASGLDGTNGVVAFAFDPANPS